MLSIAAMLTCAGCGGGGGAASTEPPPAQATPPTITAQPADQTVIAGETATLNVTANGTTPLSYQWQKGGASITGATTSSYTTPVLSQSDSGATFTVTVSNSAGSVTSRAATVTVTAAPPPPPSKPQITTQPLSRSVVAGSTATFTVVASGTGPLSYQWRAGGTAIAGATTTSYTTPPTSAADNGKSFTVSVSNSVGSVTSSPAILTVTSAPPSSPSITSQPASQSVTAGSPASFTVTATGGSLSYQWQRNGSDILGATGSTYTIPATVTTDDGSTFTVSVANSAGTISSIAATLSVAPATPDGIDILTFKYDTRRSGQNVNESTLTPANVNQATFGLLKNFATDGKVDAQPLYVAQLSIRGTPHNVLFIATEHGTVYAIDTDTYAVLWNVSLVPAGQSTSDDLGCSQVTPEIGITATPFIDRHAGAHGTMYVVAMSKDSSSYHHTLHALDITTGADTMAPREISATFTDAHGNGTSFAPAQYEERTAILVSEGTIYTAWTSHCDEPPYGGWIITYDQATLTRKGVLNAGPSSAGTTNTSATVGPGIWMSGSGPAVDAGGNVYLLTGNGPFDTTLDSNGRPDNGNYSQSFLKLHSDGATLSIVDYFALWNGVAESQVDKDLGAGGGLILPQMNDSNNHPVNLIVGAGKDGNVYILDQSHLGGFNAATNNIYQEVDGAVASAVRASPAWFNGVLYYGPRDVGLKAFPFTHGKMATSASSTSVNTFGYPGTSPTVSANGTSNAIVWAHETNGAGATLHAYDATNLANELYNSTQAANGRDAFGAANKFIVPVVSGGKVFVGTNVGVAIFGLF